MNNLNIINNDWNKAERNIRQRLARHGYKLITTVNVPYGLCKTKLYAIADATNNVIVSGERMELCEVENWLNS